MIEPLAETVDKVEQKAALLQDPAMAIGAAALAIFIALLIHAVVFRILRKIAKRSENESDDIVLRRIAAPTRIALVALSLVLVAREVPMVESFWQRIASVVMPAILGWIALAILHALIEAMKLRADVSVEDNLQARRKRTKLTMFNRIATFIIIFVTVGLILLSIPSVRDIGVTLVASAGLAGLAVGAAAQPALKSLIAGVQMALTEPINIDDVVIVEGEWGWIEDIRTTYVVVKIWDQRRLVVPTTYFLEKPFQNWTKKTAELLGTVFLYLDPATRVAPIRAEFERLIKANARWDGRVQVLQVTETQRDAKEVRLLMSAKDSPTLFDLRCDIREAMLEWLAENYPEAFAKTRLMTSDGMALSGPET
ncbi:Small-conductance mechanosensitive channel [Altererythrobacter xiamenensis]|uniref:Small-conductance mechanosensitive channel n=1 Tax=Altererythrobacter xiamenensis TaxID=1316679 RepID=A0A1Y6FHI4_9SPHN|nr:mechanosensitive ion channel family protein [Altererythrobacter xiamenensis]SMQ74177.1 Small-conductance mechanosensitive channel [Altererythrobacter xiamenensis]